MGERERERERKRENSKHFFCFPQQPEQNANNETKLFFLPGPSVGKRGKSSCTFFLAIEIFSHIKGRNVMGPSSSSLRISMSVNRSMLSLFMFLFFLECFFAEGFKREMCFLGLASQSLRPTIKRIREIKKPGPFQIR